MKKKTLRKITLALVISMIFVLSCGFTSMAKEFSNYAGVIDLDTTEAVTTEVQTSDNGSSEVSEDVEDVNNDTTTSDGVFEKDDFDLPDDYQLGDDILPDVEPQGFFEKLIKKGYKGISIIQIFAGIIIVALFIVELIKLAIVASKPEDKRDGGLGRYFIALFILAFLFGCTLFAKHIISAMSSWFFK